MIQLKDQLNRVVQLEMPAQRIVSLVPSQTELLWSLGLGERVVGITKFCTHPKAWYQQKRRVGGTKNVDLSAIEELQPDLIIANKEENVEEHIQELALRYSVYVSDVNELPQALRMISQVGCLTGRHEVAEELNAKIEANFLHLQPWGKQESVLYLIWKNPEMTVGEDTFIADMLQRNGLQLALQGKRYPKVQVREMDSPRYVFLSSEPYPFNETHLEEFKEIFPKAKVCLVDGTYFSWYGSRLLDAVDYFRELQLKLTESN